LNFLWGQPAEFGSAFDAQLAPNYADFAASVALSQSSSSESGFVRRSETLMF
jgi:hypothetical protein